MSIEFGSFSLGVVAGGVVVGIFNHYLTKSRNAEDRKVQTFNTAASIFRNAFTLELSALKNPSFDDTDDPNNLLLAAFEKHRTAVAEFRRFLEGGRQCEFDKAWLKYYAQDGCDEEDRTEFLYKYSPGWESKPLRECRDAAISNIEKLLEFASHK